jgi:hypothetical protein
VWQYLCCLLRRAVPAKTAGTGLDTGAWRHRSASQDLWEKYCCTRRMQWGPCAVCSWKAKGEGFPVVRLSVAVSRIDTGNGGVLSLLFHNQID